MKKLILCILLGLASGHLLAQRAPSVAKEMEIMSPVHNSTEEQAKSQRNARKATRKSGTAKHAGEQGYGYNDYAYGDVLVCESRNKRRNHCYANTEGGVRLVRQISRSSCRGNWGYDYMGVWVINGCRAEFSIDRYNHHFGRNDLVVRCESQGYRRNTCRLNLRNAQVSLIHQLGFNSCEGNWGHDNNQIWVSRGCRADFYVEQNQNYGGGHRPEHGNYVECESRRGNMELCQIEDVSGIELVNEHSSNRCKGNWGYTRGNIWVDRGCSAQFKLKPWRVSYAHEPAVQSLNCASTNHQRVHCEADTSGGVTLDEQLSRASCRDNWGYDRSGIWVSNNCIARFLLGKEEHYGGGSYLGPREEQEIIDSGRYFEHKCKSKNGQLKICRVGDFRLVKFHRQISKKTCDDNWGINDAGQLWVDNSCYAEFRIYP